ncbi:MAG: hypothetical protein KC503_27945 [Myxococcales bacterium]|nr:hypothetical protein [Myxococcales bacterium]
MTRSSIRLVVALALLASSAPAEAKRKGGGAIPRAMLRKVYFSKPPIKNAELSRLVSRFKGAKAHASLVRDARKEWKVNMVAFFRKKSFPGPITIWVYDKADKASIKAKEPVHVISVNASPTRAFVHELFLDANVGFNKNHTYLVQVGQLIKRRARIYASGELELKK